MDAIKKVLLLQAFDQAGVIAAVQRDIIFRTELANIRLNIKKALVLFRLRQHKIVQVGVPRCQHQHHRCALALGIADKCFKRQDPVGVKVVEALHMDAVHGGADDGGIVTDLIHAAVSESHVVQNTAVRALHGCSLVVYVAGNGIEFNGVAVGIHRGVIAAVF